VSVKPVAIQKEHQLNAPVTKIDRERSAGERR